MHSEILFQRRARSALLPGWRIASLLALALALRVLFVLVLDPHPRLSGGDAGWYLEVGHDLVTTGNTTGPLSTPPLYLIYLGVIQVLVPGGPAAGEYASYTEVQVARVAAGLLGVALIWLVYRLGRRLFSERVGLLAAGVLAVSPALIIEAGGLLSESLFMVLLFAGLALYVRALSPTGRTDRRALAAAGGVLGLATLTRAVLLLFPFGLALHLLLVRRPRWRSLVLALLIPYLAVVLSWTVYNIAVWQRLVFGGEGLTGFLYQGTVGVESPFELDEGLGLQPGGSSAERHEAMRERISDSIRADPVGWVGHRVKELIDAYLQPHNTVYYGGESIRSAAVDWLQHDRSLDGLRALTRIESFWPKLVLYVFHFAGLLGGAVGMIVVWRRWRDLLPLYGLVAYFTAIHLVLLALPRYLFPLYPVFWLFAAAWIVGGWERRRAPQLAGGGVGAAESAGAEPAGTATVS